jgi:hypothetical protein
MDCVHRYINSVLENLQMVFLRDRLLYSWLFASVKHTTELNTVTDCRDMQKTFFRLTCRLSLYAVILLRKTTQTYNYTNILVIFFENMLWLLSLNFTDCRVTHVGLPTEEVTKACV